MFFFFLFLVRKGFLMLHLPLFYNFLFFIIKKVREGSIMTILFEYNHNNTNPRETAQEAPKR
jgi:hypothetical protein